MIRRPPRSTLSSSSAASDVYKRQVDVLVVAALVVLANVVAALVEVTLLEVDLLAELFTTVVAFALELVLATLAVLLLAPNVFITWAPQTPEFC